MSAISASTPVEVSAAPTAEPNPGSLASSGRAVQTAHVHATAAAPRPSRTRPPRQPGPFRSTSDSTSPRGPRRARTTLTATAITPATSRIPSTGTIQARGRVVIE